MPSAPEPFQKAYSIWISMRAFTEKIWVSRRAKVDWSPTDRWLTPKEAKKYGICDEVREYIV
jgi:ATP-dependent protease ClpP protease subunit